MSPNYLPPEHRDYNPHQLPAGTPLIRIHQSTYDSTEFFIPDFSDPDRVGGRFDSTADDPYGFLYAASDDITAVAEVLLRDLPAYGDGSRPVQRSQLLNRSISCIEPQSDLMLVSLQSGPDLGAVGQDTWLTTAPAQDYPTTQSWSTAIRQWAPQADGIIWHSRFNPPGKSYIFYSDRCDPQVFLPSSKHSLGMNSTSPIDSGPGMIHISNVLSKYHTFLL